MAGLRRLSDQQAVRGALRRWRHVVRVEVLLLPFRRGLIREAWYDWKMQAAEDTIMQTGDEFYSLTLIAKVRDGPMPLPPAAAYIRYCGANSPYALGITVVAFT